MDDVERARWMRRLSPLPEVCPVPKRVWLVNHTTGTRVGPFPVETTEDGYRTASMPCGEAGHYSIEPEFA